MERDRLNQKRVRIALVAASVLSVIALAAFGLSLRLVSSQVFGISTAIAHVAGLIWLFLGIGVASMGHSRRDGVIAVTCFATALVLLLGSSFIAPANLTPR